MKELEETLAAQLELQMPSQTLRQLREFKHKHKHDRNEAGTEHADTDTQDMRRDLGLVNWVYGAQGAFGFEGEQEHARLRLREAEAEAT